MIFKKSDIFFKNGSSSYKIHSRRTTGMFIWDNFNVLIFFNFLDNLLRNPGQPRAHPWLVMLLSSGQDGLQFGAIRGNSGQPGATQGNPGHILDQWCCNLVGRKGFNLGQFGATLGNPRQPRASQPRATPGSLGQPWATLWATWCATPGAIPRAALFVQAPNQPLLGNLPSNFALWKDYIQW